MAAAGPRYAPPDATLPPPWRALVDGSTGYIYYWNPETNVTQYEKPAPPPSSATPPLPTGPPPVAVAPGPKLAPIPSGPSAISDVHNGGPTNGHASNTGTFHSSGGGVGSMAGQPKLAAIPLVRGPQVRSEICSLGKQCPRSSQTIRRTPLCLFRFLLPCFLSFSTSFDVYIELFVSRSYLDHFIIGHRLVVLCCVREIHVSVGAGRMLSSLEKVMLFVKSELETCKHPLLMVLQERKHC